MGLIELIILLAVVGVLLYFVETYVPRRYSPALIRRAGSSLNFPRPSLQVPHNKPRTLPDPWQ